MNRKITMIKFKKAILKIKNQKNLDKAILNMVVEVCLFILILMCKVLIIPSIVINLALIVTSKLLYKRVSNLFVYNKRKNTIEQAMSLKMYCKIILNNYYKNNDKLLDEIKKFDEKKTSLKEDQKIKCKTNYIIYREILRGHFSKNISIDESKTIVSFQPMEKLLLMNSLVVIRYIIDLDFWYYLFRPETIKEYTF